MNPRSTQRFRRITGLAFASWALFAIGLSAFSLVLPRDGPVIPLNCSLIGGATLVQSATDEAYAKGVEVGDRLTAVDGVPVLRVMRRGWQYLDHEVPNIYEIEKRSGQILHLPLYPAPPDFAQRTEDVVLHVAILLVSVLYIAIGCVVWWIKPDRAEAWAFVLFCSSMAVGLASSMRADLIPWAATRVLANFPILGATTFHFFTSYPLEPPWVVRHRRIRVVPYAAAAAIAAALFLERLVTPFPGEWIPALAFFFGIGLSLVSLGIMASQRRAAGEAGVGDRMDMMIVAGMVSFLPGLLILLAEYFLRTPFPWYFAMFWVVFFPIAVGAGMLRKQFFELRLLARSSAAYGAATLAITGLFAFMITFADQAVLRLGVTVRSAQVVFLFLAILAFNPVRERMQRLVDGVFDRDRSRYRTAVREISEAMVSMLSLREIGDRILVALTDTMGVSRAMVLLFDENDRVLRPSAWRGDWDEEDTRTEIPSDHSIWKHLWMRREELSRADFDEEPDPEKREACWDIYDTLEVELLVPILFGVDLLGVIAVGRKLSGGRLAGDDRQLLRTLANQSSIAMENAKAFDEIAKLNETLEARVEDRTQELRDTQAQLMQSEKLSALGQLVAGVAHELNNPIGFVHANLQLLDEYIRKLTADGVSGEDAERIRDAIAKLLMRSREGTERVKQIVQDLRTFSRMDQAEIQDADLHEEIDRTLALMEPRIKNNITVVRDYGDLPTLRCFPGQLNQVFLNLLMNACDVLGDRGTITIKTRRSDQGVRLEFRDDGPGIPPEIRGRLFDPFFTTKEVGKGTGLGLSLSHGIVERHRGRISVSTKLGAGACFVIDLPLDVDSGGE
ncbi:MAG: GAF domain-containing sensor histidine kinase [Deltaproteobacteria bacterium]|nr:GAF domain-containing sensor histidine kinase [Deltaproteobacteria bacterium]MBW2419081.1 GAF domain-containing sensor histidine kinase [Deltaproteobacteria bacterium]